MSESKKQPFLPLFFGDFLASTAEWEGTERSLYLTLLGYQWSLGSLPTDTRKLAKLVDWERRLFDSSWGVVSTKFVEIDGRLYNTRLEAHRAKSESLAAKNAAAGRKGAEARWQKDGERHSDAKVAATSDATDQPLAPATGATHGNPSHPIPSKSKTTRTTRRKPNLTPLPADFELTPELRDYATAQLRDCDPEQTFARFREQAAAKGWEYASWPAAFQTYCRNARPDSGHFSAGQYPRKASGGGIHHGVNFS